MIDNYVAVDLETSGLRPKYDKILEIGAVKVINGRIVDSFQTFVHPGIAIPPFVTSLTGITNEMAETGKSASEAVTEFAAFCEDLVLVGHNILFDFSFLKKNAVNAGLDFEKQGIDTLKIARICCPLLPKKSLESMCSHYGIAQGNAHRAYDDAVSAMKLYECLAKEFGETEPKAFVPQPLVFRTKKEGPITKYQKVYLNDLIKYHRIENNVKIDMLTKNQASRMIDQILSTYGKILHSSQK